MNDYIFTDLACESPIGGRNRTLGNPFLEKYISETIKLTKGRIQSEEEEKRYGRQQGTYITVESPPIWQLDGRTFQTLVRCIAEELRALIQAQLPLKSLNSQCSVMVAGLGNSDFTPDAIGPETVKNITVTRHLSERGKVALCGGEHLSVSALVPGVIGTTGIETAEIIKGTVRSVRPDVLIVVDALAARSCERLAATVQLSDAGILPGSGIGNVGKAICAKTVGVPVIAMGVPTVVNSSTLIIEALEKGGWAEIPDSMRSFLDHGKGFFVTPKETDLILKSVSLLLASAIDLACTLPTE